MKIDLSKITTKGKCLLLAYDQGIEHGPIDFTDENVNPQDILDLAKKGGYNGIILQKGVAEKYYGGQVPLIVKLNGKTRLSKGEPYSSQVCSVKEAKDLGAVAIGYTIYLGSEFESKMLKEFGQIEQEAEELGLIVIAWMYPRGKAIKEPTSPEIIAYAARAGLELGADYVKINYPGSIKALRWAVKSAGKTKVLIAGGKKLPEKKFLKQVEDIMSAGAAGLAVGRNVWQHKDPLRMTEEIKKIIFDR